MYVHNPLNPHTALWALFASSDEGELPPSVDADLVVRALVRYRVHATRSHQRRGIEPPPAVLVEDDRELIATFRRFLPAFLDRYGPPGGATDVIVIFPCSAAADARGDAVGGDHLIYVTSGMLDAIELFARTVSLSARLNELAIPTLAALEERPPEKVPLAWVALNGLNLPGHRVNELIAEARVGHELIALLQGNAALVSAVHARPSAIRYRLSYFLMQLMMRAVRRAWIAGDPVEHVPGASPPDSPIDARYLAVLALTFVVMHELGHHVLSHDTIGFRGSPAEVALADALAAAFEPGDGEQMVPMLGSGFSFELAADAFALEVVDEADREPMLEAASLWSATLERSEPICGDRFDDLGNAMQQPDAHPSWGSRVWYLNGRFSTGRRQGHIARQIAEMAETATIEPDSPPELRHVEAETFRTMWQLGMQTAGTEPPDWMTAAPPAPEPPEVPDSEAEPGYDVIAAGITAWEAGRFDEAMDCLRRATDIASPRLIALAHGLIGRLSEERGDAKTAEAAYRLADDLGDPSAANDLGLLLAQRGDLDAAEAAYRRADGRDHGPGAYNLGLLLDETGDRGASVDALHRADIRQHAQAAWVLGHWAFEAGDLDGAEAAWSRADERGAVGAATNLGTVLLQRGDQRGAEDAFRRGAERGELDAVHNLGYALEQRGDLDGAADAYAMAVSNGRSRSMGNLGEVMRALEERDRAEAELRRQAESDAAAAYELATKLVQRGDVDGARDALTHAERLGHPHAAGALGKRLIAAGDPRAAEAAYRRGAALDDPEAINGLGFLLSERGDLDGAEQQWKRADELGDAMAASNLGQLHELAHDDASAEDAYRRASDRGYGLGSARLGQLLERLGRIDEARDALAHADDLGDEYGAACLGDLYFASNELEGAEQAWRRADQRGNADAAYRLGVLFRRTGRPAAAEAALRRALRRGHPSAAEQLVFVLASQGLQADARDLLMNTWGSS